MEPALLNFGVLVRVLTIPVGTSAERAKEAEAAFLRARARCNDAPAHIARVTTGMKAGPVYMRRILADLSDATIKLVCRNSNSKLC
jgi:hypothetical protein